MNQVEVKKRQILAFSHILEMAAILILGGIIKDNGVAYFAAAYECFSFLWILLGRNVADTLGKLLRGKSTRGQYKNAGKIRKYTMICQCAAGAAGGMLLGFGGPFLVTYVFRIPLGASLTAVLALGFVLRMIGAALLGYFQGEGSELPAAVSGVLRQVFFLGFGLLFCNIFKGYGEKVSALLGRDNFTAMYGAMGAAVAASMAELLTFLFLVIVYKGSSRKKSAGAGEGMRTTDTFGSIISTLYGNMGLSILIQLFERLPLWLGIIFLQKSAQNTEASAVNYGVYYGKYLAFGVIFVLIVIMLLIPIQARVSTLVRREEQKAGKTGFQAGLHMAVVQGLFFSVFLAGMGNQVAGVLCGDQVKSAGEMLSFGSFAILFAVLASYFSGLLLLTGRKYLVLGSLGGMNILYVIAVTLFLNVGKLGVQSLVYAGLAAGGALCLVLGFLVCAQLRMSIEWIQTICIPVGCACAAGLLCLFLGKALTPHLGNLVTVIVCFLLSALVYWVILVLLRNFREQELKQIPGGGIIRALGQMLRVFRV